MAMDFRIVEFAEVLRQNGIRVGSSEAEDAVEAAAAVGVANPARLKSALQCSMIKRARDVSTFERTFGLYFSGLTQTFQSLDKSLLRQISEHGFLEGDELQKLISTLKEMTPTFSPLARGLFGGDWMQVSGTFRGAVLRLDWSQMQAATQVGFFSRRLLAEAGISATRRDFDALIDELRRRGLSAQGLEGISRSLSQALLKIEQVAQEEVRRQTRLRTRGADPQGTEKSFGALSHSELEMAQTAVRRLAEKLKTRLARRERTALKGAPQLRKTLRRNLTWGGIPMVLIHKTRRPRRPEVVVLCDVSDSVRNTSRLMLLFMHTLQARVSRVRSFVFVSQVEEISAPLKETNATRAIDSALAEAAVARGSNSNYGRVLADFVQHHLSAVTHRTMVFLIGDGRNNYNPANPWALEEIRRRCRRLLWICPEEKASWGTGDSEMLRYAGFCHQVLVVRSLGDLSRLADQLVPR